MFLRGEKFANRTVPPPPVSRVNVVQTRLLHRFPAGSSQTGTFRTMVSMETGKWFPRKAEDSALKHPAGCCHYISGELWISDFILFFSPFLVFFFWAHTEPASCLDIISSTSTAVALILCSMYARLARLTSIHEFFTANQSLIWADVV